LCTAHNNYVLLPEFLTGLNLQPVQYLWEGEGAAVMSSISRCPLISHHNGAKNLSPGKEGNVIGECPFPIA
jgi:hypothetical protein